MSLLPLSPSRLSPNQPIERLSFASALLAAASLSCILSHISTNARSMHRYYSCPNFFLLFPVSKSGNFDASWHGLLARREMGFLFSFSFLQWGSTHYLTRVWKGEEGGGRKSKREKRRKTKNFWVFSCFLFSGTAHAIAGGETFWVYVVLSFLFTFFSCSLEQTLISRTHSVRTGKCCLYQKTDWAQFFEHSIDRRAITQVQIREKGVIAFFFFFPPSLLEVEWRKINFLSSLEGEREEKTMHCFIISFGGVVGGWLGRCRIDCV